MGRSNGKSRFSLARTASAAAAKSLASALSRDQRAHSSDVGEFVADDAVAVGDDEPHAETTNPTAARTASSLHLVSSRRPSTRGSPSPLTERPFHGAVMVSPHSTLLPPRPVPRRAKLEPSCCK